MMGTIKPSKDRDLVAGDSKVDSKWNNKAKKPLDKIGDKPKSQGKSSNSKKKNSHNKKGKGEMNKCTYSGTIFHP